MIIYNFIMIHVSFRGHMSGAAGGRLGLRCSYLLVTCLSRGPITRSNNKYVIARRTATSGCLRWDWLWAV
jgi:hypothetical protein